MARGLPDHPPQRLQDQFVDEGDEATCPACGWDTDDALQDPPAAHAKNIILAVEAAEGAVFGSMGGAQPISYYFKCPNRIQLSAEERPLANPLEQKTGFRVCGTLFTVEVEDQYGGMS